MTKGINVTDSFFVHPRGLCESPHIGMNTRIWANVHILPGAVIGGDCNICDGVFVENQVVVGDRVTIKSGVQLWDGVSIGNDVFIGPNVTFSNDQYPRSRVWQEEVVPTIVHDWASIGANATVLAGVTLGENCMVGAGSVVTHSVPPNAIVFGNPARIQGYATDSKYPAEDLTRSSRTLKNLEDSARDPLPGGARLVPLTLADDMRGFLAAIDFDTQLPFVPRRFFTVFGVPSTEIRGEHSHRTCHQFIVCMSGSVSILVDDGVSRTVVKLSDCAFGLYMPPLIWSSQYKYSPDTVLGVFASEPYSSEDYIRSYQEYKELVQQ
jgi:acetyltransferase-like isoleucine patch superfamily enzyme